MSYTAGIDVGSTYTKAVVLDADLGIVGRSMQPTGFRLAEVADSCFSAALQMADLQPADIDYTVATGFGRHQVAGSDVQVTDLTAAARGAAHFFPTTRTVLDVGGQTLKASRLVDRT